MKCKFIQSIPDPIVDFRHCEFPTQQHISTARRHRKLLFSKECCIFCFVLILHYRELQNDKTAEKVLMKAQAPLRQGKGPAAQGLAWWPHPSHAPPSPYLGSTAQRHMSYGFIFPHLTTILPTIRMIHFEVESKYHDHT